MENKILVLALSFTFIGCHATYNSNVGWHSHQYARVTDDSTKICRTYKKGYHTSCVECFSTVQQQEEPEITCNKYYWRY